MPSSPRPSSDSMPAAHDGARSRISRRTLAKGAAWAAPVIVAASAAPAAAASLRDIIVGKTACTKASRTLNNINFTVTSVYGATLPVGTVFTVNYGGGSTRPTWSGALATNSNVAITPGSDSGSNGGRWGVITFTLKSPMPANTTWDLTITMDIGATITNQSTSLTLSSSVPQQNTNTSNDKASHSMFFGGCRD